MWNNSTLNNTFFVLKCIIKKLSYAHQGQNITVKNIYHLNILFNVIVVMAQLSFQQHSYGTILIWCSILIMVLNIFNVANSFAA